MTDKELNLPPPAAPKGPFADYSAEEVEAYALEYALAVLADRAQQGEPVATQSAIAYDVLMLIATTTTDPHAAQVAVENAQQFLPPAYQIRSKNSKTWTTVSREVFDATDAKYRRIKDNDHATKVAAPADAPELVKLRERVAYLEAMLDARLERKPDDSQQWAKIDGAIAFHLIERHADDWNDAGRMMDAWRDANRSAPVPDTGIPTAGEVEDLKLKLRALVYAASAVIERWESPKWKDEAPTADYIARLREAVNVASSNSRAPDSTTPTSGEVEKAESRCTFPECVCSFERMVAGCQSHKRKNDGGAPSHSSEAPTCTYPKCNCPMDAPSDPNWCARGLARPSEAKAGEDA